MKSMNCFIKLNYETYDEEGFYGKESTVIININQITSIEKRTIWLSDNRCFELTFDSIRKLQELLRYE